VDLFFFLLPIFPVATLFLKLTCPIGFPFPKEIDSPVLQSPHPPALQMLGDTGGSSPSVLTDNLSPNFKKSPSRHLGLQRLTPTIPPPLYAGLFRDIGNSDSSNIWVHALAFLFLPSFDFFCPVPLSTTTPSFIFQTGYECHSACFFRSCVLVSATFFLALIQPGEPTSLLLRL